MKLLAAALLLLSGCRLPSEQPPVQPDPYHVKFSGEVSAGQDFEREFGNGLLFRLAASKDPVIPGWIIEVRPKNSTDPEMELSWVATPPFRGINQRHLDISYGISAAEAVAMSPRQFSFLRDPADYAAEAAAVRALLWPAAEDSKETLNPVGTAPRCAGIHRILDHRLTNPSKEAKQHIEWMKFEVELCP